MDSLPLEPIPVEVTVKPLSFRKIWRYFTSVPVEPSLSTLVKTCDCGKREVVVKEEAGTHGFVIICDCGASLYLFRASLVSGP